MVGFMVIVTFLSACLGGIALLLSMLGAKSAPQEAAGAAMAVALAVIPYVIMRCAQIAEARKSQATLARIAELLEAQANGGSPPPRQDVS